MSSNDLWFHLYNIYYPESNNLPEAVNVRTEFYSPLYHWDEDLYQRALSKVAHSDYFSYVDLRFPDNRRTIEEITNTNAKWKLAKCLEPLPRTEGRFFCFAMNVIRCEINIAYVPSFVFEELCECRLTFSYVGFGISPQLPDDSYLNGAIPVHNSPHSCPWIWHTLKGAIFKKGDQVGLVGCVKDGYYLCNFFINDQFHPWYKYEKEHDYFENTPSNYYISSEKEVFVHFGIVTGEKFTITRPKLGNIYYYNKFKDSPAYKQGILYRGNPI
jgi:hypothetical protein